MILIFGTCFHGNVCMIHRPVKVEYKLTRRLDTSYHIHYHVIEVIMTIT